MFHPASSILTAFRPVQHLRHMLQPVDCRQAPPAWRGGPWRWSARRRAQCFSPGGVQTVSPGRTGPPEICTRPTPETTLASGRSGQVVRAPGSNVTSAVASRAGDPVRGHPARRRRPGCEHRDLILTGEYVRSSRDGGWSNLWGTIAADQWAWFIGKKFAFFRRKTPLLRLERRLSGIGLICHLSAGDTSENPELPGP